jgi:hypothetical protein
VLRQQVSLRSPPLQVQTIDQLPGRKIFRDNRRRWQMLLSNSASTIYRRWKRCRKDFSKKQKSTFDDLLIYFLVEYLEEAQSTNFSGRIQKSYRHGVPNKKRYPSFSNGYQ